MNRAFFVLVVSLSLLGVARAAPATVLIRVPAGTAMPAKLGLLLSTWRQAGKVSRVLLLAHGKAETAAHPAQFEAMAVLEFPTEEASDSWQKTEAMQLPPGLIVRAADVLAANEITSRDASQSVFIVNTYSPTVSNERFSQFVAGYVRPLYQAMQDTKALVGYTVYLERGEVGKADALNVLEYQNAAAFDAVSKKKQGIRDQLTATVPSYASFDKIKDTLRLDGHGTTATFTPIP